MKIIAIDPGLDVTGVALFDLDRFHELGGTSDAAYKAFAGCTTVSTSPAEPMEARHAEIHLDLLELLAPDDVTLAYLELPAFTGDYDGTPTRRETMHRMLEARGAILGALGMACLPVVQVRAGQSSKEHREEVLERGFNAAGLKLPRGPRGGKREDEWDAIWLGYWALTTRVMRDVGELLPPSDAGGQPLAPSRARVREEVAGG